MSQKSTGSAKSRAAKKSALQIAGGRFVDELGKSAIEKLKSRLGLNTELHVVDVASGSGTLGNPMTQIQGAITVPQGITNSTRVGDSVRIVSWEQRIRVWQDATNTTNVYVRLIGFHNRHNAPAVSPAVATVLAATGDAMSPLAVEFAQYGFQLVFDHLVRLSPGTTSTSESSADFTKVWRPEAEHMTWVTGDTTGVQADLTEGGLYVYAVYESLDSVVAAPKFRITSRLTFVDN